MWFTATTQKSINRLLENERNLSFNINNFDQILRGIFGPATFCFTAVLSAAKAISMLLSTKIYQIAIKFQTKHSHCHSFH